MSYKVHIKRMKIVDARWLKSLKKIIYYKSCSSIECYDCPFSLANHIERRACSSVEGLCSGAQSTSDDRIIKRAKWLYSYLRDVTEVDVNSL